MLAATRNLSHSSHRWRGLLLAGLVLCGAAMACGPTAPPPVTRTVEVADRAFLLSPVAGYSLPPGAAVVQDVERAHARLVEQGDPQEALALVRRLEADASVAPVAAVLAAQAAFVAGRADDARERLAPVVAAQPTYAAAQLLWGRLAERAGDPVTAFIAYRAVRDLALAANRAQALERDALAGVRDDFRDALDRGRIPDAELAAARLHEWAPAAIETILAERELAAAKDDTRGELAALRKLTRLRPDDPGLAERQAELEVAAGDAGRGVEIFERLAAGEPGDPRRREQLQWAKFQWRLTLLPPAVRTISARYQLDRADLATLLYWVAPGVRRSRAQAARIASDVLDHPRREEIVRVVNLGLMDLDETLHRFSPGAFASRGDALRAVVLLLAGSGRQLPCVSGVGGARTLSRDTVCATASACGLVPSSSDCVSGTPVSGAETLEWLRLSAELMGEQ